MTDVVNLADRRNGGGPPLTCPFCQCVWFNAQAVHVDAMTLSVVGYVYPLVCTECSGSNDGYRWSAPTGGAS